MDLRPQTREILKKWFSGELFHLGGGVRKYDDKG